MSTLVCQGCHKRFWSQTKRCYLSKCSSTTLIRKVKEWCLQHQSPTQPAQCCIIITTNLHPTITMIVWHMNKSNIIFSLLNFTKTVRFNIAEHFDGNFSFLVKKIVMLATPAFLEKWLPAFCSWKPHSFFRERFGLRYFQHSTENISISEQIGVALAGSLFDYLITWSSRCPGFKFCKVIILCHLSLWFISYKEEETHKKLSRGSTLYSHIYKQGLKLGPVSHH